MTAGESLAAAWQTAAQTAGYLFAYAYALALAPLLHLVLVAWAPGRRGQLATRSGWLAAVVLGLTEPLSRRAFDANLLRLGRSSRPGPGVVYLAISHTLTAYSWVLIGPLLGKDFLLSHVVGVALFVLFAAGLVRWLGLPAARALAHGPVGLPDGGAGARVGVGLVRFVFLAGLGLALGGVVAAWGFSDAAWAPADVGGGGMGTQLVSVVLGLGLALVGVPPVANLFVGTYLWKVGLAHAGIVAFFCAAPAAPTRWRLYARLFGRGGAVRLVTALLVAALLAGLATAWLFGAFGMSIHYKLVPQQLWAVR